MGWLTGFEPAHDGITIHCLNRLTTATVTVATHNADPCIRQVSLLGHLSAKGLGLPRNASLLLCKYPASLPVYSMLPHCWLVPVFGIA